MKHNFIRFFVAAYPFLLTIALWHLSHPYWNPAGVLALIPIFFCTFVKKVNWFPIFSVIMCMIIDYKFQTVCFWVAMYCLAYALNGFQNWIDLERMDNDAVSAFSMFITLAIAILTFTNLSWTAFGRGVWIILWTCILYKPIVATIKKVRHD
jgi:hypothetical protein